VVSSARETTTLPSAGGPKIPAVFRGIAGIFSGVLRFYVFVLRLLTETATVFRDTG